MKGWRTIGGNVIGGLALIGTAWGLDISPETQTALLEGIAAALVIFNGIMRVLTTGPVGTKD